MRLLQVSGARACRMSLDSPRRRSSQFLIGKLNYSLSASRDLDRCPQSTSRLEPRRHQPQRWPRRRPEAAELLPNTGGLSCFAVIPARTLGTSSLVQRLSSCVWRSIKASAHPGGAGHPPRCLFFMIPPVCPGNSSAVHWRAILPGVKALPRILVAVFSIEPLSPTRPEYTDCIERHIGA